MHPDSVLDKVLVSRHFQIYQLMHTIIYDLPKRIEIHKPKVIVISGLLDQFLQEPSIDMDEFARLISQIIPALHKIKDVLIVLTSRIGDSKMELPTLPRIIEIRPKNEFDDIRLNLSIYNQGRLKRVSMTENDLNEVTV